VTVETRTRLREAVAFVQAGSLFVGAERAPKRTLHAFRHFCECHFAVQRRENGAADEGRAA
jgi:hypothetical protein